MPTPLPSGWETDVLIALGAPVTPNNIHNLDVWQKAEGGSTMNPDSYNPLDTTLPATGSHPTNSVGVQAYPNWQTGLFATVHTLQQRNMAGIVAALKADAPLPSFAAAVNSSPWGSHLPSADSSPPSSNTTGTGTSVTATPTGFDLGSIPIIGGILSPLDFLNKVWKLLTNRTFWIRVGEVFLGAGLLFTGLWLMARETSGYQSAKSAATTAAVAAV